MIYDPIVTVDLPGPDGTTFLLREPVSSLVAERLALQGYRPGDPRLDAAEIRVAGVLIHPEPPDMVKVVDRPLEHHRWPEAIDVIRDGKIVHVELDTVNEVDDLRPGVD